MSSGGPTNSSGRKFLGIVSRLEPASHGSTTARLLLRLMGSRTRIMWPSPIERMAVLAGWATATAGHDSATNATAPTRNLLAMAEVCSFGCRQSPTGKRPAGVFELRRILGQKSLIHTAISSAQAGDFELWQRPPDSRWGSSLSFRHYGYRKAKFISFSEPLKGIMEQPSHIIIQFHPGGGTTRPLRLRESNPPGP